MVKVSTPVHWLLRLLAVGYMFFLVAWPVSLVAVRTFEKGTADLSAPSPTRTRVGQPCS